MRILIADDQACVRSALRLILEQEPEVTVVGEAADAAALFKQAKEMRPDMVLLDWELPGFVACYPPRSSEERLLSVLRTVTRCSHLVVMSGRPETRQSALAAGADEFVSKVDPPERLLEAVRALVQTIERQAERSGAPANTLFLNPAV
jgi:DNA-binding NarL/FixJ family response regulator